MANTSSQKPQRDKTVLRLDGFPELMEALRDGDLLTGRMFCAQLFGFDPLRNLRFCPNVGSETKMKLHNPHS